MGNQSSGVEPQSIGHRDDDELIALCARDDTAAFARLVARHRGWLVGFAIGRLKDREAAECACQIALLRLWQSRHAYAGRGLFAAYLRRLCLNACRELSRSGRRRNLAMARLAAAAAPLTPLREGACCPVEQRERQTHVDMAISRLPPHLGEAILLRYFRDMSYAEMAAITGCAEVTLRSRIHHALKQLRSVLDSSVGATDNLAMRNAFA